MKLTNLSQQSTLNRYSLNIVTLQKVDIHKVNIMKNLKKFQIPTTGKVENLSSNIDTVLYE